MLNRLMNAWSRPRPVQRGLLAADDLETPRYPPFMKGLPAHSGQRLLDTQAHLIGRLREAVGQPDHQFDAIYMPLIRSYANYVHLLPASEAHHHRGAGGLLRHGLEVALWATQGADRIMFARGETPETRRTVEPVWRCAVFLAALAHDVGKPLSDLQVTDADGEITWAGQGETLVDWLGRTGTQRYFLHWRNRRHMRHESLTPLVLPRIIPQVTMDYLNLAGPELYEQMLFAVSSRDFHAQNQEHNPIFTLVREADQHSTRKDISDPITAGLPGALGVPLERYIMDAIRRLAIGRWKCNQPGARIWAIQDSLFIVWPAGANDIVALLRKDDAPGIPQQPETLADVLIDRGLAVAFEEAGSRARLWPIQPSVLTEKNPNFQLSALRIDASANVLAEPPVSIPGVIGLAVLEQQEARERQAQTGEAAETAETAETTETEAVEAIEDADETIDAGPMQAQSSDTAESATQPSEPESPQTNARPQEDAHVQAPARQPDKNKQNKNNKKNESQPPAHAARAAGPPRQSQAGGAAKKADAARRWFGEHGHAGAIVSALAEDFRDGTRQWGQHGVCITKDSVAIRHPDGWAGVGAPSRNIVPLLVDAGWVEVDSFQPMKRVREIDGFSAVKGSARQSAVVLAPEVSTQFLAIATVAVSSKPAEAQSNQSTAAKQKKQEKPRRPQTASGQGGSGRDKSSAQPAGADSAKPPTPDQTTKTPDGFDRDAAIQIIHELLAEPNCDLRATADENWLWLTAPAVARALTTHRGITRSTARVWVSKLVSSRRPDEINIPKMPTRPTNPQ